jgi:hypothetical protein
VRRYTVEVDERGWCNVIDEYGRETGRLAFDEMLGQMVSLAHPEVADARYTMQTPEAWERLAYARAHDREARLLLGLAPAVGTIQ